MILGHQLPQTKAAPPVPQTALKTPSATSWVISQKLLIPLVGAREPNPQFACLRFCHLHFQPESRRSGPPACQPRKDPACSYWTQQAKSICTDAAGWTRACNLKLKPSEAFLFLSFMWKRQDTRCTLSGNNNDCQNRRILIEFNTEADKRGKQQRKQYYTILRTINHLLV